MDREHFLTKVFPSADHVMDLMKSASRTITDKLYKEAHGATIGSGAISLNEALCENLFALYVCVLNNIFVIIGISSSLNQFQREADDDFRFSWPSWLIQVAVGGDPETLLVTWQPHTPPVSGRSAGSNGSLLSMFATIHFGRI